jgi:hypothetical protein
VKGLAGRISVVELERRLAAVVAAEGAASSGFGYQRLLDAATVSYDLFGATAHAAIPPAALEHVRCHPVMTAWQVGPGLSAQGALRRLPALGSLKRLQPMATERRPH